MQNMETPPLETNQSDIETRRKARRIEVITKNHELAITAYEMENFISREDILDIKNPEIQQKLGTLPENLRTKYDRVLSNYFRQRLELSKVQSEIEEIIELNSIYNLSRTEVRDGIGEMVFKTIQERPVAPFGKIKFETKEGYLLLIFDDQRDYTNASLSQKGGISADSEDVKSGGEFHYSMRVRMLRDKYYGPMIFVRGDYKKETVDSIIAHERQHFINHRVLGLFSETENFVGGSEEAQNKDTAFRRIKDEVLAYMRDGSAWSKIKDSLSSDIYNHLFSKLSPEDQKEAKEVLDNVSELLGRRATSHVSDEGRAIMVYQLASVPFSEFPKWLEAIQDYYYGRFELLNKFDTTVSWCDYTSTNDPFSRVASGGYPPRYSDYLKKIEAEAGIIVDQLREIRDRAQKIVFDQKLSIDVLKQELRGLEDEYKNKAGQFSALYEPLKKGGVLTVISGEPTSYQYGEDVYDGETDNSEYLISVRDSLLEEIDAYSQEDINAIAKHLNSTGTYYSPDTEIAEQEKLEKYIKTIVHKRNGSRPCRVSMGKEEHPRDSFYVLVDFRVSKKENERGIKGAEISLTLHGEGSRF